MAKVPQLENSISDPVRSDGAAGPMCLQMVCCDQDCVDASMRVNGAAAPEISGPEITRITQIGRTTHESLWRTLNWLDGGHQPVSRGPLVGLTLGRRLRHQRKAFGAVVRHSRGDTKSDAKNSSIPRIRPRFHNRVRSPQSGLSQLCHLRHTATGHMC